MAIQFQGKTSFVRQFIAAVQAAANAAVDATKGSFTLALGQAATGVALFLQAQIAKVLLLTRAATSTGSDLDSFYADYFFYRLPAVVATGTETFSRATPTLQAVVPIGQLVSTGPGGIQYIVTTDTSNAAYNASLNGYVLAPTVSSVTVPIAALNPGATGNVLAGTITSFVSPIPGVDTCTNGIDITNGKDAEVDASFRVRFQDYIASLREGTPAACRAAILATRQGLTCVILENLQIDGVTTDNGFVTFVVDDGTGSPSSDILNGAAQAVDGVRAAGIRFGVIAPTIQNNVVAMTLVSADSTKHAADIVVATAAVLAYVNGLGAGATLVWARLYQVAFDSSANITDITGLLLNGGTADVTAGKIYINKATATIT